MPDIDFYGYERDYAGTYLYSSDVAAIYFDNNGAGTPQRAGLVQNVSASYQHSVLPRFEAGSSELYWVTGQAQGSVGMGRLVSYGGLLSGIQVGQGSSDLRNGILGGVNIKIGKLAGQLRQVALPQSQLVMTGCVLESYSTSFTTGALEVSEMTAIRVALMKKVAAGGSSAFGGGSALNGSGFVPAGGNTGVGAGGGLGSALAAAAENQLIAPVAQGASILANQVASNATGIISSGLDAIGL
jgi:hypothetical protein